MNCNEKELKAKLYNNRAITHFKLGKMTRALICFFFYLLKHRAVTYSSSFLIKVIILNFCQKRNSPEKCSCLTLASNIQRSYYKSVILHISMSITSFS